MRILLVLSVFLIIPFISAPAMAQLVGSDTAPGDSCAGKPPGATRMNADPDQDGKEVVLICDGSIWRAASEPAADPDRGIQFNSGGNLTADANLTYTSTGRLGIGVANPLYTLDLNSRWIRARGIRSPVHHAQTELEIVNNDFQLVLANRTYIFATKSVNNRLNLGTHSDTNAPRYINIGHNNLLRVDKGAFRVGVGVAAPEALLDVAGEVKVGNTGSGCVAATEGALRYSTANSCMELCDGLNWGCMQAASCPNSLPDAFSFTDEANATTSTLITSNIQQVSVTDWRGRTPFGFPSDVSRKGSMAAGMVLSDGRRLHPARVRRSVYRRR